MNSLLYWLLLSVLISLLVILTTYLIISIIWDIFIRPRRNRTMLLNREQQDQTLNKYKFDKKDVEDLTRIEKNFKTDFPRISFSNEVKNPNLEEYVKERSKNLVTEINLFSSSTDVLNGSLLSITEDEKEQDEADSAKIEELAYLTDPKKEATLAAVSDIEKRAKRVEDEMNYFVGGTNDLQFYEINEKYIKLMIELCDIKCDQDQIRKKKNQVMLYIEQCQNVLKIKSRVTK